MEEAKIKPTLTNFGKEVKKRLIDLGMKDCQLEQQLGMRPKYLNQILYGKRNSEKYINLIAATLGIDKSRYIS